MDIDEARDNGAEPRNDEDALSRGLRGLPSRRLERSWLNERSMLSRVCDPPREGPGEGCGEVVVSGDQREGVIDITDHT